MIHETPLLFCELSISKKAPRHRLFDIFCSMKSSGEIDQFWPPKERATFTVVEQANERTSTHAIRQGQSECVR